MASNLLRQSLKIGTSLLSRKLRTDQFSYIHSSPLLRCKSLELNEKDVIVKTRVFETSGRKDKGTFLDIIASYQDTKKPKRGHVEFIYAAMKCMAEYNVEADLECYKSLMDIFPKGKMIAKNLIQSEFYYFPRHQDCALDLLDMMETNVVYPDKEMRDLIVNIFGKGSHVYKKLCRMRYWMPKFINLNPYKLPVPIPSDIQVLAELALKKMSVDPRTKISHFKAEELEDSLDKTWIASAQSYPQQKLLLQHKKDKPLYVEGPFLEWMGKISLFYFILKADPVARPKVEVNIDDVSDMRLYMFGEPKPKELEAVPTTEHEQEDATIFGMCMTGTSSKDSVLSWIRFLQKSNPILDTIPVLFKLRSAPTALTTVNASSNEPEAKIADENATTRENEQTSAESLNASSSAQ